MPLTDEQRARIAQQKAQLQQQMGQNPGFQTGDQVAPGALPSTIPAGVRLPMVFVDEMGNQVAPGTEGASQYMLPPPGSKAMPRRVQSNKPAPPKTKAPPSGQLSALQETDDAIAKLQKLISTMEEKRYKTGPLNPKYYRNKVGNFAMQMMGNPEENTFKSADQRFANAYASAETGANRGFKEIEWLSSSIPNASDDFRRNYLSKAYQNLDELQMNKQRMLDHWRASGYTYEDSKRSEKDNDPLGIR